MGQVHLKSQQSEGNAGEAQPCLTPGPQGRNKYYLIATETEQSQRKHHWAQLMFDFWWHSTFLCSQETQSWDEPCWRQMVSDLQYHTLNPRHHIGLHRAQGKGIMNPQALLTPHVELHWMLAPEMFAFARELHPYHHLHLWTPGMPLSILALRHQSKGSLQPGCFPALTQPLEFFLCYSIN